MIDWFINCEMRSQDADFGIPVTAVMNLFWPHFLGGCELRRDTGRWVKEVGPWSQVELVQPVDEPEYQVVPHIKGVLVK